MRYSRNSPRIWGNFAGLRVERLLEIIRGVTALALLQLLRPLVVKLGSPAQQKEFAAEWATHDQEIGDKWIAVHRQELFANVGLALSQSAGMEELLIGITCLLLRTHDAQKVGTIMYSIISFPVWLRIITELFSQEPRYKTLTPWWHKMQKRLQGLKQTRDRLAHHTIYFGDKATTLAGGTSLRPGRFDFRQEAQKYQPLNSTQISEFIDAVGQIIDDLRAILIAMTDLLNQETSQSSEKN